MRPFTRGSIASLILLAATVALSAPPSVAIVGPTQVIPGSAVFLQGETDAAAVDWIVFPPSAAANFVPLTLYQGQTPDGKPILKYAGFFSSPTPGSYTFVLVGTKQDQLAKASHTLINGTPGPDPSPNPPIPPVPTPGVRFVLVVTESLDRNATHAPELMAFRTLLGATKHQWRIEDPNLKDSKDKPAAWLQTYLEQIKAAKVSLPALVVAQPSAVAGGANTVLSIEPFTTAAAAVEAVKKAGG